MLLISIKKVTFGYSENSLDYHFFLCWINFRFDELIFALAHDLMVDVLNGPYKKIIL